MKEPNSWDKELYERWAKLHEGQEYSDDTLKEVGRETGSDLGELKADFDNFDREDGKTRELTMELENLNYDLTVLEASIRNNEAKSFNAQSRELKDAIDEENIPLIDKRSQLYLRKLQIIRELARLEEKNDT